MAEPRAGRSRPSSPPVIATRGARSGTPGVPGDGRRARGRGVGVDVGLAGGRLAQAAAATAGATARAGPGPRRPHGGPPIDRSWLIAWSSLLPVGALFVAALADGSRVWRRHPRRRVRRHARGAGHLVRRRVLPVRALWLRDRRPAFLIGAGASLAYGVQADAVQVTVAAAIIGLLAALAVTAILAADSPTGSHSVFRRSPTLGPWAVAMDQVTTTPQIATRIAHDWLRPTAVIAVTALVTAPGRRCDRRTRLAGAHPGRDHRGHHLDLPVLLARRLAPRSSPSASSPPYPPGSPWRCPASWTRTTRPARRRPCVGALALVLAATLRLPTPDRVWTGRVGGHSYRPGSCSARPCCSTGRCPGGRSAPRGRCAGGHRDRGGRVRRTGRSRLAPRGGRRDPGRRAALVLGYGVHANRDTDRRRSGHHRISPPWRCRRSSVTERERIGMDTPWVRPVPDGGRDRHRDHRATALGQWPERPLLVAVAPAPWASTSPPSAWWGDDRLALVAAPVPIGAAWLVFASEALTGNPQWFTVPTGLTLLAVVGLTRIQDAGRATIRSRRPS